MKLQKFNSEEKFSSVFIAGQINEFRKVEGNRKVLAHFTLLRKIETEFSEEIAGKNIVASDYSDSSGKRNKCYNLTFEESLQLLMSESKTVRKGVVAKLKELSSTNQVPQTFSQALMLAARQAEQIELQQAEIQGLEQALDTSEQWISIVRASQEYGVKETFFKWRELKAYSEENGIEVKKAPCPRFKSKNLYHISVYKKVYPELQKTIK